MSIANYITFVRIFVSPIFLLVYLMHDSLGISSVALPYVLLLLLFLSEISDAVDGYLARKYNEVTDFGKIVDPMADSIFRLSVLLTFTQPPVSLPIPLIFIFFYRDSVISTLRTICALKNYALAARMSGKIKAAFQATASFLIILLMIPHSLGSITQETLQTASMWIVGIASIYTIYSGFDYIFANRRYIRKLLVIRKEGKETG